MTKGQSAPVAILRADGSRQIGFGHLIRSLTLLTEFHRRGWRIFLATRTGNSNEILNSNPIRELARNAEIIPLPGNSELTQAKLMGALGGSIADLLIVDHYSLDGVFEAGFIDAAACRLVIDDLADRPHDCEFLVDSAPSRVVVDYRGLTNPKCRLLLGNEYSILRPEFAASRRRSIARHRKKIDRILVAPGATDASQIAIPILQALSKIRSDGHSFAVTVILSSVSKSCAAVREFLAEEPQNWKLLVDRYDVAEILSKTDLAIGTMGSASWERACLGIPSIAVVVADNQLTNSQDFEASGGAIAITLDGEIQARVSELVRGILRTPKCLNEMSESVAKLCDGKGSARIADAVEAFICNRKVRNDESDTLSLTLRPVREEDCECLFQWQCAPETRRYARNPAAPSWTEHRHWFEQRLRDEDDLFMMVETDDMPAGVVRLDPFEGDDAQEVSISLAPEYYSKGIALTALKMLSARVPDVDLMAYINPKNAKSIKLFLRAGFSACGGDWYKMQSQKHGAAGLSNDS